MVAKNGFRIVLLTDFSEAARKAYPVAADLARRVGGRVTLLHVLEMPIGPLPGPSFPDPTPLIPEITPTLRELIRTTEEKLAEERTALPAAVADGVKAIVATSVAEGIVEYAGGSEADVVVLSTHGRTGLRRLLMGSVANALMHASRTPLLVVPLD